MFYIKLVRFKREDLEPVCVQVYSGPSTDLSRRWRFGKSICLVWQWDGLFTPTDRASNKSRKTSKKMIYLASDHGGYKLKEVIEGLS